MKISPWPLSLLSSPFLLLSLSVPLLWSINGRFLQPQVCFCVMNLNDPLCRRPNSLPSLLLLLLKWHKVFSWAYFLFSPLVVVVVAGRLPASTGGSLSQCGRQALPWRSHSLSLSLSLARCDNTCRRKIFNNLANDFSSGGPGSGRGGGRSVD